MAALIVFNGFLMKAGVWGTIFFMVIIAIVIPYEVIGRYVFEKMNIWTGEVSTYSMVWASMLGAAVGLKKGYQVSMTSVTESIPPALAKLFQGVAYLFTLIFFGTMLYQGLLQTVNNAHQTSPAMGLVMSFPYAGMPAGFLIMFFFTLEEFLKFLGLGAKGGER
jgi:TRAP-type C4-dicarboxylate transport system permease small subunit